MNEQCDVMDYIDEELAAILGGDFTGCRRGSSSAGSNDSSSALCTAEPHLQPSRVVSSSAPVILNFGKNDDVVKARAADDVLIRNKEPAKRASGASKTGRVRPASQTYDHILAERKRREQLSQCFIALSALVPGLKKMDKTSVLGDTIKYLKHLQDRVKTLEEQTAKQTIKSTLLAPKSHIIEDEGSSDEISVNGPSLPEINARVCGKSVLLKVYCEKRKGVLARLLAEVENLNLDVVNTSVTPFRTLGALDITVVAEMDKEVILLGRDIVNALRSTLLAAGY